MNTYGVRRLAHKDRKPKETAIKRSLIALHNPQSVITEQYRSIRNNIRFAAEGKQLRSLVVTSPSGGEGKSTSAVNLAICFAQRGEEVLLVDANVRNPILNHVFDLKLWPGLTDVLAGHNEVRDSIQQVAIERLSVLPGGSPLGNATDLLDSEAMLSLIDFAANHYDMVLFDSSSVLGTPDAVALASKCDGVLMVIQNGNTRQAKALEAKRMLELGNANMVGAVFTRKG